MAFFLKAFLAVRVLSEFKLIANGIRSRSHLDSLAEEHQFYRKDQERKGNPGGLVSSLYFRQIIILCELVKVAQDPQDTEG